MTVTVRVPPMTDLIGTWVTRITSSMEPLTKPHLVDSIVTDEPFTRCGRRLRTRQGTAFAYSFDEPESPCRKCRS